MTEFFTKEKVGAAARIDSLIETMAGRTGSMLVSRAQALGRKIEVNTEQINAWTARLDRSRERMLLEFYRMELAIGKIQNNSGAIQAISPLAIDRNS